MIEDISQITGIEHAQNYSAGEVIFEEGQAGECMYWVLAGELEVSIQGRPINSLLPGSIFGEMALVDARARSATIKAITNSRLVPVDRDRFSRLVQQSPDFALQVMGTMSSRLRNLLEEEVSRQRMEEELKIGRDIQLSLLPKDLPEVPGWEFASFYRAAREVGGDLYDFIQIPDDPDNLAVVIADVTGKGVPAALFMAFGRTAIRAEVMNGRQPADTLRRTNRMILLDTQSPLLMSAFLASFNLKSGTMTYACAGHDRPLWVSAKENDVSIIDGKGIVLGVFEGVTIEEKVIEIDSGDFVIFYTDGVTEARQEDYEFFELERLIQTVGSTRCGSAQEMVDAIVRAVEEFTGDTPQADDLTLVVARRL
jgi:sigma-B regulation protein RsbU (phosphoserine phosphatase)